ncbi:Uncharacterised protein [Legionella pneumophila]|nr:Uncharacterised protein [Legionella pneumophila]
MAWNQIAGSIQPYNPALMEYLRPWHLKATDPQAAALLLNELGKQSLMLSYINTFAFIMWSFLIMLPFVLLLKQNNSPATSIVSE